MNYGCSMDYNDGRNINPVVISSLLLPRVYYVEVLSIHVRRRGFVLK